MASQKQELTRHSAKEHKQFNENKRRGIVSIQDAKTDKYNLKILAQQYRSDILSATTKLQSIERLRAYDEVHARELFAAMPEDELKRLLSSLNRAGHIIDVLYLGAEMVAEEKGISIDERWD